jgi:hypothetical protein
VAVPGHDGDVVHGAGGELLGHVFKEGRPRPHRAGDHIHRQIAHARADRSVQRGLDEHLKGTGEGA